MSLFRRVLLILIIVTSCVSCDQATKSMAQSALPKNEPISYLGDTIQLRLTVNRGAFLSLGESLPRDWRRGLFIIGVGLLLLGTLAYALVAKPGHFPLVSALALVFAGGLGNLLDRIVYDGYVVDFMNVGVGPVRTGVFNVADLAITFGIIIALIASLKARPFAG